VLRLADVIAVGVKSPHGYAPPTLARRWLALFDWSTWRWDADTVGEDAPVQASVTMAVPLTDGTTARLHVSVVVRSSSHDGAANPALRAEQVLCHGQSLTQAARVEGVTRASFIAHINPWLREQGCALPLAVTDTPHPEVAAAAWSIITDSGGDDPFIERVRESYFTEGVAWPNQTWTGSHVDTPHDQTLAQTLINSLLRLRRPADGVHEDAAVAALGCDRTTFQREVYGWSGGSQRIGRPALVQRHADGRLTPLPCCNPDCVGRGFASTVRWTPLTQPWGLVCPTCGHTPDPSLRDGPLPASFRTPTTDAVVSLTATVKHITVPQLAKEFATSEHIIGAVLEAETLPFHWDGGVRRVPITVLDRIAQALEKRGDGPDLPEGVLTTAQVASRLQLSGEQVRHHTRTGRITQRDTATPTGGWTYDAGHIEKLASAGTLTAFRSDTVSATEFAAMLGLNRGRDVYALLEHDAAAPVGYPAGRGSRWLIADARTYAANRRADTA
jgi:hypothetical protein